MAKIDNFTRVVDKELKLYSKEITEEVANIVKEEAETMAKNLRLTSPRRRGSYPKQYYKGWTSKKMSHNSNSISYLVYNKNKPQLTHLLEYGHILSTGERSEEYPHINKAQDEAEKRVIERIERVVK